MIFQFSFATKFFQIFSPSIIVVYFGQRTNALHAICWLKLFVSVLKNGWHAGQNLHFQRCCAKKLKKCCSFCNPSYLGLASRTSNSVILLNTNTWYQLIVSSLQLYYVLIDRTPPYITRLEARKQGLAYIDRVPYLYYLL